jgi:hypothetical protein
MPLGSHAEQETRIYGPSNEAGSEEFILNNLTAITKQTEVTVSTRAVNEGVHRQDNQDLAFGH